MNTRVEYEYRDEVINLIYCRAPYILPFIEDFDFGICQIAFDGQEIITSQAFLWDVKHSVFTLRHGLSYEKSKERYERISQRYPGWQMKLSDKAVVEATKIKGGIKKTG